MGAALKPKAMWGGGERAFLFVCEGQNHALPAASFTPTQPLYTHTHTRTSASMPSAPGAVRVSRVQSPASSKATETADAAGAAGASAVAAGGGA
jgi:hypothetical protein